MTKNVRALSTVAIGAVVFVLIVVIGRDVFLRAHGPFECGDGPRRTIDVRDFTTQYSAESVELEANVTEKARISVKLSPTQLQQLSEATQNAREFRKYVVAGYNSCAVTKVQYGQYGARFQALDNMAREINELTRKPTLAPDESAKLARLISQYGDLAQKLGTE